MNASTIDSPADSAAPLHARLRIPLMLLGVAVVVCGVLYWWLFGGRYVSTDDAYVQAGRVSISANVSGRVIAVDVHDNQPVRRGDVLFTLDPQPYQIAVAAAQAKLAGARLEVEAGKASYRQQLAALRSARESLTFQQSQYERQHRLAASGISSQTQFDQAKHALDTARQMVASTLQQGAAVLAMLGGNPDIDPDHHPTVQQARAELDRAELNLSYTTIRAAQDGIVTKVEQLQVGDYINAANSVFALISTGDLWIEANFKESQLTHMRVGQSATVDIDTYPGKHFKAHVQSIAPGTGSQFSMLPPENASGNWVKVVQRLPVRLAIEDPAPELALHAGLSADVEVDTDGSTRSREMARADDRRSSP